MALAQFQISLIVKPIPFIDEFFSGSGFSDSVMNSVVFRIGYNGWSGCCNHAYYMAF